jgi:pyruvate,orthophosphate dikinase
VSHAAVVARGWGKPAVVGAEQVKISGKQFSVGATVVKEGDVISLDGSTGQVVVGAVDLTVGSTPPEFDTILGWADEIRKGGKGTRGLKVRANADNGPDAARAREFGAEGIGLCRTEHMFLGEDRLPIVRAMILADTEDESKAALEQLRVAQKADYVEILEAMDGLPVTVRLLDPPLHEFLPNVEELAIKQATTGLTTEETELLAAARSWHEVNPMLGTRGVRLGVVKPGLYEMQVRALMEAAADRKKAKGNPIVEIMIPLTISRDEMALARGWVQSAIDEAKVKGVDVTIGTMIEVPRAALLADQVAEFADFFSFGTNDLTQMTLGFSRDDIEGRIMAPYVEQGLLKANPFDTLDQTGVGQLVEIAAKKGRQAKPDLKLGVCGEHGGDPDSIYFLYGAGLDYVSCSPFRVPIARLAAAQAVLGAGRANDTR